MAELKTYEKKHYNKFIKDMKKVGLKPYHYRGRFFWEGPAVNVDNIQDALSNTKVPCQHDGMGLGYVVYPRG